MEKAELIEQRQFLQNNEKNNSKKTNSYTARVNIQINAPKHIRSRIKKLAHILQINPEFPNVFANKPITAFKINKNIKDLIHNNLIKNGKAAQNKLEKQQGKSKASKTIRSALCCMQVENTNTFKSK